MKQLLTRYGHMETNFGTVPASRALLFSEVLRSMTDEANFHGICSTQDDSKGRILTTYQIDLPNSNTL